MFLVFFVIRRAAVYVRKVVGLKWLERVLFIRRSIERVDGILRRFKGGLLVWVLRG